MHVYWALGGRAGAVAALPESNGAPIFRPRPASTFAVAGLLAFSALLVLAHSGRGPATALPAWVVAFGAPVAAVVLIARAVGDFKYVGFFKKVRGTRFAALDTRIYSPMALLLGLATAAIAWSTT